MNHIYFTALAQGAGLAEEIAKGDAIRSSSSNSDAAFESGMGEIIND
jgi:hypothetical protein